MSVRAWMNAFYDNAILLRRIPLARRRRMIRNRLRKLAELHKLTRQFPKEELYGLTNQIRRAEVSIPSNIAEGRRRGSKKEFVQFLRIAYGSGAELETQLEIAKNLPKMNECVAQSNILLDEVMKMLNVLIRKLKPVHKS